MSAGSFDMRVRRLGADLTSGVIGRLEHRRLTAQMLQERFACSRVGLWRLFGEPGQRMMRCIASYSREDGHVPGGDVLREHEYRGYMAILSQQGVFVCEDTRSDPRLAAMRARYLLPRAAHSIMDAAFMLNGQAWGVLCCEQSTPRAWTPTEVAALRRCAVSIGLHVARLDKADAEPVWDTAAP